jgi:hypothetical protein
MRTLPETADERVLDVQVSDDTLRVDLTDGRSISVPIVWFPRLSNGTPAQRARWKIVGAGFGIHWPALDEDISTAGLLRGRIPRIRETAPVRKATAAAKKRKR